MKTFALFLLFTIASIFFVHAEEEIISYEYAAERVVANSLAISDIEARILPMKSRAAAINLVLFWLERRYVPQTIPQNNRELQGELWRLDSMYSEQARENMVRETRRDLARLRREIEDLELQKANTALSVENQLRTAIFSYIDAKNSVEILKNELLIEEENFNHLNIRYGFGMVSRNTIRLAEINLNQLKLRLEESLLNLDSLSRNLSLLLNLDYEVYIEIDTDISFEEDENAIIMSPTIRRLQIAVDGRSADLQSFLFETRHHSETGSQRNTLEYNYNRAITELNRAINTMQNSLYNGINELGTLTAGRVNLYAELENALNNLEVAYLNLSLGRITDHSLNQTRLNIQRIEQRLERNSMQIWLLIFRLQNPSLL